MSEHLVSRQDGKTVIATLDRQPQLNALTGDMCETYRDMLSGFDKDDGVEQVILNSASPKAFCAGGDVVDVALASASDDPAQRQILHDFFHGEYQMNVALESFSKPHIALIDGYCMGGGVGISVHGSHRIVTEKAIIAMPETRIGLFPDVGATHFLGRMPGGLGQYIGLTGIRLDAADCLYAGFATHFVPRDKLADFEARVVSQGIEAALADFAETAPGGSALAANQALIDRHFGLESVEAIIDSLQSDDSDFARQSLELLGEMSPLSLKITFAALRANRDMAFRAAMITEFRIVQRCVRSADFREGIRALLIDKDKNPKWQPATVTGVQDAMVEEYFRPLRDGAELDV